jgi:hypothetical protein
MGFGGPVNLGTRMLLFLFGISKSCGFADIGCKLTSVFDFVLGLVVEGIWCTRTGITTEQVCALSSSLSTLGFCNLALHSKILKPKFANKEGVYTYPMLLLVMCADGCNITELMATSLRPFAVHVWLFVESTQELLVQKRADRKDSWPGLWDISSAGHITAGDTSLLTARQLQCTRLICLLYFIVRGLTICLKEEKKKDISVSIH